MISTPIIDHELLRDGIKQKNIRIVDVRREDDYKVGHIKNSVNLPLAKLLNDDSVENIAKIAGELGISDNTPVVVYDDTFGALSSRVVWALQYIGHNDVKLLSVTFSQWKELGLDVTTKVPEIEKSTHSIKIQSLATDVQIIRTKESMRSLLKNRGIPEDAEIITYCGSVGTLSGLAYYALKSIGVPNVKLYVHSFKEWKNLEKPIDKQENASYWDLSAE